ncbi:MAG: hypothetical protein Q7U08_07515 [Flavobacteriaceae bacterium]|nr:hypothetical protein [Flavobacteriaceae bacterium]
MKTTQNKMELIGFHETKRNIWKNFRRFSLCDRLQQLCNRSTVYYR